METVTDVPKPTTGRGFLVRCLRTLHLADSAFRLRGFLYQFLRVDGIRTAVAALRYFYFVVIRRRFRTLEPDTGNIRVNTVLTNRMKMKSVRGFAVTRSNYLLYPLSVIQMSKAVPVLSIGPRTEGEILNLMGLGFRNIRALDLISYSPWITLGDMHAMPYKDDAFAVVIMGWCLTYSSNRRKAALEAVRVTRDGGIIAVGAASSVTEEMARRPESPVQMKTMQWNPTWTELLGCFEPHVGHLFFSHDLPPFSSAKQRNLMALFSVKKSPHGSPADPLRSTTPSFSAASGS